MTKKRMDKEGAIELSMTTVIVIILGVILLTLGLAFVRGVFTKVSDLTDTSFSQAEAAIGQLGTIENELTLTSRNVDLEQGKDVAVGVVVKNFDESDVTFQLRTSKPARTAQAADFDCLVAQTEETESRQFTLGSGEERNFVIAILDQGRDSPLGRYVCNVELIKGGEVVTDDSILIEVI